MTPLLLALVVSAHAGGFEVAQQGAQAAGVAHAGTALVDSAESAWFNPAALTDGRGFRAALGVTLAQSRVRASSLPDGEAWSARTDTPLGTPPYAYLSWAWRDLALAFSANVPFGGGVRWPDASPLRFESLQSRPQFFRFAGSAAYRVGPISLGAGVHADVGSLRVVRATDHVGEEGRVTMLLRGRGLGGAAYVHARLGPYAALGASYKSRTRLRMAGEADFDLPPVFAVARPDQPVRAEWTLPDRVALAFAWSEEAFLVTLEAGLTLWSVNRELVFDFEEPLTPDVVQTNRWRDALALRAGAAGRVHDLVVVRGGLYVDGVTGAPPPSDLLGPSSPDGTRLGATLGLGLVAGRHVRVDGFVEPMVILPRSSTSLDLPTARYSGWAMIGGLGVTFLEGRAETARARRAPAEVPVEGELPPLDPPPAIPVEEGAIWGPQ